MAQPPVGFLIVSRPYIPALKFKTKVVKRNLNPEFEESFEFPFPDLAALKLARGLARPHGTPAWRVRLAA